MFALLRDRTRVAFAIATGLGTSIGLAYLLRRRGPSILSSFTKSLSTDPYKKMVIEVANSEERCISLCNSLKSDLTDFKVLGFDCEWIQQPEKRRRVALLQFATVGGRCVLIQLCKMKTIPDQVREILEDKSILKVGVEPLSDANHLLTDYNLVVNGTLDVRYFCKKGQKMSLSSVAERELGVPLPKGAVRSSDWEAKHLTDEQLEYAAKDALCGILIFQKTISKKAMTPFFASKSQVWEIIYDHCKPFLDVRFRPIITSVSAPSNLEKIRVGSVLEGIKEPLTLIKKQADGKKYRAYCLRKTLLYHNTQMLAPDGELLCTCDTKKAEWYVAKGIAEIVDSDPFTIKLNFEPSGRGNKGSSGQYYTQEKENQCVVCGERDSYLRKKIVPHEYRKYFPNNMKKHQSHDVLLLCAPCHTRSNTGDLQFRYLLAEKCNAPFGDKTTGKVTEDKNRKRLRSAARALSNGLSLPDKRREELETIIFQNTECTEITSDILNELVDIDINIYNKNYMPHGLTVVQHFSQDGVHGIMKLERQWREHFLKTMNPQFLPPLWSVDHYHEDDRNYYLDDDFLNQFNKFT